MAQVPTGFVPDGFIPDRPATMRAGGMTDPASVRVTEPPAWNEPGGDVLLDTLRQVAAMARGAGKELGAQGVRGGAMLRQIPGVGALSNRLPSVELPITPEGGAERAGQAALRLAEFLTPTGATRGLGMKALAEGARAAGVTALQGGTPGASAVSGGVAAAVPLAGPALRGASRFLRGSAEKNVSQALEPTTRALKKTTERVTPEVLKRRTYALTREGLVGKSEQAMEGLSKQYDEAAALLPTGDRLLTESVRQPIRDAMQGLVVKGSSGTPVPLNPLKYKALQELDETMGQLGDKVSRETLQAFKQEWDDAVARAGGFTEKFGDELSKASLWAKRHGAGAIRQELAKDAPNIDKLNAEWAFHSKIVDVAGETITRKKPQQGFVRLLLGGVGAAAGGTRGTDLSDRAQNALIGGVLGSQVIRAIQSPGWKLAAAHAKNALAQALASGETERVSRAIGRVIASMPVQYQATEAPE